MIFLKLKISENQKIKTKKKNSEMISEFFCYQPYEVLRF